MDEDRLLRLIVGLGNPGVEHCFDRHNVGFWFVDALARRHGGDFRLEKKFLGEICRLRIADHDVWLLKPQTYMNRSGASVRSFAAYLKIPPEKMLIVHDDLDLPPGTVRLKSGGGHGGHNGLRDTISHLGADFYRLRIGIGHPGDKNEVLDYVLRRAGAEETDQMLEAIRDAADVMPLLLGEGYEKATHKLHSRGVKPRARREGAAAAGEGGDGDRQQRRDGD